MSAAGPSEWAVGPVTAAVPPVPDPGRGSPVGLGAGRLSEGDVEGGGVAPRLVKRQEHKKPLNEAAFLISYF